MSLSQGLLSESAHAQSPNLPSAGLLDQVDVPSDARFFLQADELVYDYDNETVTAQGDVRIAYGGYNLVARRVIYEQNTGRLKAFGNIELVEPGGNTIYAEEIDVTDDFAIGFVNALRIETSDNTRIAATSAERLPGDVTVFNRGVYTACEPCEKKPNRAPIWQVKAKRVVKNGEAKTIRFENARFEFFGLPVAYLPFLTIADETVKRKSGFLFPRFRQSEELGYGLTIPYYLALNPSYDATIEVTPLTRQGFLSEVEFRQRLENGQYNLKIAGISQREPEAFDANPDDSFLTTDARETDRGMIGTKGDFTINPRWVYGWDLMLQSDSNFSNTYDIEGFDGSPHISEIYLTGLSDRNFFDLRAMKFDVQAAVTYDEDGNIPVGYEPDDKQPLIHPVLDYSYTFDQPVMGGQVKLDANLTSLSRDFLDCAFVVDQDIAENRLVNGVDNCDPFDPDKDEFRYRGLAGQNTRASTELEWKRAFDVGGGLRLTPVAALRGDAHFLDLESAPGSPVTEETSLARGMVTAGLEATYPILFQSQSSSHVFEPIAQIYTRPDEDTGNFVPNEDAQAFVFDASTLFQRDKFTGYDRIEGGTRANVGFRYTGSFDSGLTLLASAGQSFQLAGTNSFAEFGPVNAGASSGLETDRSDYVGMIGASYNTIGLTANTRLDEESFEVRSASLEASGRVGRVSAGVAYAYEQPQEDYGFPFERHQVKARNRIKLTEEWSAFSSATFDIERQLLTKRGIGLAYDDECFSFAVTYNNTRSGFSEDSKDYSIGVRFSLRTIGDFDFGSDSEGLDF